MSDLFSGQGFRAKHGSQLPFKIECDALSDSDIDNLARLIACHYNFCEVVPVMTGGLRLAMALERYANEHGHVRLIVDDVLTSGLSMEEARAGMHPTTLANVKGVVLFAWQEPASWIQPVFQMKMGPAF